MYPSLLEVEISGEPCFLCQEIFGESHLHVQRGSVIALHTSSDSYDLLHSYNHVLYLRLYISLIVSVVFDMCRSRETSRYEICRTRNRGFCFFFCFRPLVLELVGGCHI